MSGDSDAGHAERMDATYRYQRHVYDLTRKYFLLGRDELIAGLNVPSSGSVLEIGCGTGRNLLSAAKAYPDAAFFALDISAEMLGSARRNLTRSGHKVVLKQADACRLHTDDLFGNRRFDRVFFSYSLSMIPDWKRALHEAQAMLAPAGSLHVVDFGQQEALPRWFKSALFHWLRRFHVEPRADLFETIRHMAQNAGADSDCRPLYRGYAWRAVLSTA